LLISIFILLLISVVAIALIVASGTESSLAGNYRSATGVYYASLAGLEEARGRLLSKDPNSFRNTAPAGFLPSPGSALPMGFVRYVVNPGPTDGNVLTTYPDGEYPNEFGTGPTDTKTTPSIWTSPPLSTSLNLPGPLYKWVRINSVSEKSIQLDVDGDSNKDNNPLYYDGTKLTINPAGAQPVFEITSLAVLPNGSQKMLQYLATSVPMTLPYFPAAITFAGNPANTNNIPADLLNYGGPDSTTWYVDGTDSFRHSLSDTPSWSCTPNAPLVYALGYTNPLDNSYSYIHCCKVLAHPTNYTGVVVMGPGPPGTNPSVHLVTMPPSLQTPTDYNNLAQTIIQNADVILTPGSGTTPAPYTAYGSDLSTATTGMNSSNPMTIVIRGDLDLTGWHHEGYGLLLVTGHLQYDPDASWYGIVMIIGKGTVDGSRSGSGEFDGATLLARTVDPSTGAPLASLGGVNMQFANNMGGVGYYYSSCWINNSLPTASYKILSFHEISQ
jgi:hypothetical protein